MAAYDSCAYGLDNTATPPRTCIKSACQPVKGAQSPIYSTASLLFSTIVAVVASWRSRSAGDMCRKSIFISFRNERLRKTTHWPRHIYREEILRRAWWLHIILVVVWGMECGCRWLGGFLAPQRRKIKTPKVPISARPLSQSWRRKSCSVPNLHAAAPVPQCPSTSGAIPW